MVVEVHIWRSASGTLSLAWLLKYDATEEYATFWDIRNVTLGSAWFNSVTLTQRVEKRLFFGAGAYIKGDKTQETIGSNGVISQPFSFTELTLVQQIGNEVWRTLGYIQKSIYDALPQNVREFIDQAGAIIYDYGSFAWTMLNSLWSIVIENWVFIIGIYPLYLVYLIFKCMEKGDWTELVEHFFRLSGVFLSLGNAVLGVIRTIVNLIKWW